MAHDLNGNLLATSRRHPAFWLEDGSVIVRAENDAFKIHWTLLTRHSPYFSTLPKSKSDEHSDVPIVLIPDHLGVSSLDFEALLQHLYHDMYACFMFLISCVGSDSCIQVFSSLNFEDLLIRTLNSLKLHQSFVSRPNLSCTFRQSTRLHVNVFKHYVHLQ